MLSTCFDPKDFLSIGGGPAWRTASAGHAGPASASQELTPFFPRGRPAGPP